MLDFDCKKHPQPRLARKSKSFPASQLVHPETGRVFCWQKIEICGKPVDSRGRAVEKLWKVFGKDLGKPRWGYFFRLTFFAPEGDFLSMMAANRRSLKA